MIRRHILTPGRPAHEQQVVIWALLLRMEKVHHLFSQLHKLAFLHPPQPQISKIQCGLASVEGYTQGDLLSTAPSRQKIVPWSSIKMKLTFHSFCGNWSSAHLMLKRVCGIHKISNARSPFYQLEKLWFVTSTYIGSSTSVDLNARFVKYNNKLLFITRIWMFQKHWMCTDITWLLRENEAFASEVVPVPFSSNVATREAVPSFGTQMMKQIIREVYFGCEVAHLSLCQA